MGTWAAGQALLAPLRCERLGAYCAATSNKLHGLVLIMCPKEEQKNLTFPSHSFLA